MQIGHDHLALSIPNLASTSKTQVTIQNTSPQNGRFHPDNKSPPNGLSFIVISLRHQQRNKITKSNKNDGWIAPKKIKNKKLLSSLSHPHKDLQFLLFDGAWPIS
jgi:hypothetical protein